MLKRFLRLLFISTIPILSKGQDLSIYIDDILIEDGVSYTKPFTCSKFFLEPNSYYQYTSGGRLRILGQTNTQYDITIETDNDLSICDHGLCLSIRGGETHFNSCQILNGEDEFIIESLQAVVGAHDPYKIVKPTTVHITISNLTFTQDNTSFTLILNAYPEIPVNGIDLNRSEVSLDIGQKILLEATLYPSDATVFYPSWSTSDPSIALVNDCGEIEAISYGEAFICASSNGVESQCHVIVRPILAEQIIIQPTEVSLYPGESISLISQVLPYNTSDQSIYWQTSNPNVALVDNQGVIMAIDAGNCIVTATCGDVFATCMVTVLPILPTSITLNATNIELDVDQTQMISALVLPEDATDKTVIWTSFDSTIASVDNGLINAVSSGSTTIMATTINGIAAYCNVIVHGVLISSINFDSNAYTLEIGESMILNPNIFPEEASNKNLVWRSSNVDIISVDDNGKITAHSLGEVIISAITTDGSYLTANCTINSVSNLIDIKNDKIIYIEIIGDKRICVNGIEEFNEICIFNAQGVLIYKGFQNLIELPRSGFYIIQVDGFVRSIFIK